MPDIKKHSFSAIIQQAGTINAAFVNFPFDTEELFGKKARIKIKALFDGKVEYRGSLSKMKSDCHILGLTQAIRRQLGKSIGDEVSVTLWEETEERTVEIPGDIEKFLVAHPTAKILFDKMSYTHRKEYIRWVTEAKKEETRERRKVKMVEMILEGKKGV